MMCTRLNFIHPGLNPSERRTIRIDIDMWLEFACRLCGGLGLIWCVAQSPQEASAPTQAEEVYAAAQQIAVYVGAPRGDAGELWFHFSDVCVSSNLSFLSHSISENTDSLGTDAAHQPDAGSPQINTDLNGLCFFCFCFAVASLQT